MFVRSFWKRQLETSSRYSWIVPAYKGLKHWVAKGNDHMTKMKRYILRHLKIPSPEVGLTGITRLVSVWPLARCLVPLPPPCPQSTS